MAGDRSKVHVADVGKVLSHTVLKSAGRFADVSNAATLTNNEVNDSNSGTGQTVYNGETCELVLHRVSIKTVCTDKTRARKKACTPKRRGLTRKPQNFVYNVADVAASVTLLAPATLNNVFSVQKIKISGTTRAPPVNLTKKNTVKSMYRMI